MFLICGVGRHTGRAASVYVPQTIAGTSRSAEPPFCRAPRTGGVAMRVCVPIPTLGLKEGLFVSFQTDGSNPFRPTSIIESSHRLGRRKWNVP
jgi:hypothetical protein